AAPRVLPDRDHLVSARIELAIVDAAGHGAGGTVGGGAAGLAPVARFAVQERRGRWNLGTVGAVWTESDRHRDSEDLRALAGQRRRAGAGVAGGGHGARYPGHGIRHHAV